MKVLHLANHVQDVGNGIVNVMVDLACRQAETGIDVEVGSGGGSLEPLLASCGVRHHTLGPPEGRKGQVLRTLRGLRLLAGSRYDIVHAHMREGVVVARLARPLARYRVVATVHNVYEDASRVMGLADRVIAVSRSNVPLLQAWGIPDERIRVVMNGPLGGARRRRAAAASVERVPERIVTVAGMYERKGIAELIDAFERVAARVPRAELVIVGDGPDRGAFERRAADAACAGRIRFVGFQADVDRWLRGAGVFVLSSRRESCPLVVAEAREAGCAVVATDVDGVPETVDGGAAGRLVPARDAGALAEALIDVLGDRETLEAARRAAASNLDRHRVERVADEVRLVYDELLAHHRATA